MPIDRAVGDFYDLAAFIVDVADLSVNHFVAVHAFDEPQQRMLEFAPIDFGLFQQTIVAIIEIVPDRWIFRDHVQIASAFPR